MPIAPGTPSPRCRERKKRGDEALPDLRIPVAICFPRTRSPLRAGFGRPTPGSSGRHRRGRLPATASGHVTYFSLPADAENAHEEKRRCRLATNCKALTNYTCNHRTSHYEQGASQPYVLPRKEKRRLPTCNQPTSPCALQPPARRHLTRLTVANGRRRERRRRSYVAGRASVVDKGSREVVAMMLCVDS